MKVDPVQSKTRNVKIILLLVEKLGDERCNGQCGSVNLPW